jgi:hypothetical protein
MFGDKNKIFFRWKDLEEASTVLVMQSSAHQLIASISNGTLPSQD